MNKISVKGQVMYFYSESENIPEGQVEFSLVEFVFSKEWEGYKKTAQFVQGDLIRNVILVEDKCFVPTEFKTGSVTVAIRGDKDGGSIGTANQLELEIVPSFAQGGTPPVPPPPDLYNKLLEELRRAEQAAKESETKAAESASNARLSEDAAEQSEANAELSAKAARTSEGNAEVSANNAEASSVAAGLAKKAAAGYASQASQSATEAKQSAQEAATSAEGIEAHEQNAGLYADAARKSADKAAGHERDTRKLSAGAANNAKSASESAAKAALENQNAQAAATAAKGSQNSAAQSATRAENAQSLVEQDAKAVAKNTETFGQYLKSATEVSQRIEANVQVNNQTATKINKDAAQVRSDKTEVEAAEKVVKTAEQNVVKLEAATQEAKTSAEGSASMAEDSATKAAQSEANAKASEEVVQNSAKAAAQSATDAGNSATQASQSSTQAGTAAGKAEAAQKAAEAAQGKATEEANRAKTEADRAGSAVAEGLEAQKKYVNNTFAGAFVDHAVGEVIASDMVSPVEHDVGCRVEGKNNLDPSKFTWRNQNVGDIIAYWYDEKGLLLKAGQSYMLSCGGDNVFLYFQDFYTHEDLVRQGVSNLLFKPEKDVLARIQVYKAGGLPENITNLVQLEKGSVSTPYTPYVPDLSAVKVSRYGKNLFKMQNFKTEKNGIIIDIQDGKIHISGTASARTVIGIPFALFRVTAEKYIFGGCPLVEGLYTQAVLHGDNGKDIYTSDEGEGGIINRYDENAVSGTISGAYVIVNSGITLNHDIYPQIEKGTKPTEYEKSTFQIYSAEKDGTVPGMTSLSPNMTILSDTPGVLIQADYNLDGKKYVDKKFEELQSAILSQGANI